MVAITQCQEMNPHLFCLGKLLPSIGEHRIALLPISILYPAPLTDPNGTDHLKHAWGKGVALASRSNSTVPDRILSKLIVLLLWVGVPWTASFCLFHSSMCRSPDNFRICLFFAHSDQVRQICSAPEAKGKASPQYQPFKRLNEEVCKISKSKFKSNFSIFNHFLPLFPTLLITFLFLARKGHRAKG